PPAQLLYQAPGWHAHNMRCGSHSGFGRPHTGPPTYGDTSMPLRRTRAPRAAGASGSPRISRASRTTVAAAPLLALLSLPPTALPGARAPRAHGASGSPRISRAPRTPGAAATLLALLSPPPTALADEPGPVSPPRGSAHMGMGVLAHDGRDGTPPADRVTQTEGVDVSSHQGNVAWQTLWNSGVKWAFVKATEGTYYRNPYFGQQYNGSYDVGMIRGTYHFATPDTASGAAQADYFVDNGGG